MMKIKDSFSISTKKFKTKKLSNIFSGCIVIIGVFILTSGVILLNSIQKVIEDAPKDIGDKKALVVISRVTCNNPYELNNLVHSQYEIDTNGGNFQCTNVPLSFNEFSFLGKYNPIAFYESTVTFINKNKLTDKQNPDLENHNLVTNISPRFDVLDIYTVNDKKAYISAGSYLYTYETS